jgi:DNA-binding NarL/FixJ family response regulator
VAKAGSEVTRLLIADESELVRSGLRAILEAQPNWQVIAEAVDGEEAIRKAIEAKPDVAIINALLPLISGTEVTRQIRMRCRRIEVLVFMIDEDATQIDALVKAGARGFLNTATLRYDLIEAVEALTSHSPFLTARVTEQLLKSFLKKLSSRSLNVNALCSHSSLNEMG